MSKVMTIASSCEWWILSASSSVNEIVGSSIPFVLRDHPKSWTFCTTLRYIFFDLEDCLVKVPPMITFILYFSKWGTWWFFHLSLQLLIFMIPSNKVPQLSLSNEILDLLLQVITLVHVMPMISMEVTIFILIALVGISFHLLQPL